MVWHAVRSIVWWQAMKLRVLEARRMLMQQAVCMPWHGYEVYAMHACRYADALGSACCI